MVQYVLVEFTAEDEESSLPLTVDPPMLVSTEEANQLITGYATNAAGLRGYGSVSISLDKTVPRLQPR
ncbi:hypothetical protein [Paenibacillus spongiae]|uniref:DUF2922 domain-containing protein n=1 Tax=Paenibacillus spongiae TaxID=2909671 RepID=A0ABY5SGF8_9BACL|nr:hypothetical protein [Paenibacillus spongiae]UVI33062.1 hypothetical protein L1F29_15010 [Paenibacillus spongiae]